jgi:hypothetical protein
MVYMRCVDETSINNISGSEDGVLRSQSSTFNLLLALPQLFLIAPSGVITRRVDPLTKVVTRQQDPVEVTSTSADAKTVDFSLALPAASIVNLVQRPDAVQWAAPNRAGIALRDRGVGGW